MAKKFRWKGIILYGSYLGILGITYSYVEGTGSSATIGLSLALLLGAAMAVFWPRW
ncbi:hypothetical protein [Desulforamulus aeronauticus]|uniref:hypothetical protein n=1 Tax=Desulforamulus aeronauticus TaxID=53343 RepID=UPI001587B295|nr:hypothetical protein [Desulforamulus aeronauticus]